MYTNWEQDDDLSGCPVPDLKEDGSAPDPVEADCTLGAMSHYVLNATSADHAAEAVKFAAKNNLRFRIKNVRCGIFRVRLLSANVVCRLDTTTLVGLLELVHSLFGLTT